MIEVSRLKGVYEEYRNLHVLINNYKIQIEKIKRIYDIEKKMAILEALEFAKKELDAQKYERIIRYYIRENKELNKIFDLKESIEISEEEIREIYDSVPAFEISQYIILIKEEKEYLVDLISLETVDLTNETREFKNFIIEGLEYTDSYIGEATVDDLPLLMVLKEQFDVTYEEPFMGESEMEDIIRRQQESNAIIKQEFEKAHNLDTAIIDSDGSLKQYDINYILGCDRIKEEWDKLDLEEKDLTFDEYWTKYYKLLIIFGNDIEKVYKEAKDPKKQKCVIKAYLDITETTNYEKMPRTASPIVNCEVLKRKEYIKNKSR